MLMTTFKIFFLCCDSATQSSVSQNLRHLHRPPQYQYFSHRVGGGIWYRFQRYRASFPQSPQCIDRSVCELSPGMFWMGDIAWISVEILLHRSWCILTTDSMQPGASGSRILKQHLSGVNKWSLIHWSLFTRISLYLQQIKEWKILPPPVWQ